MPFTDGTIIKVAVTTVVESLFQDHKKHADSVGYCRYPAWRKRCGGEGVLKMHIKMYICLFLIQYSI